ncbi:MAG: DUF2085 domain-containing protein [Actinomycetota bacterium]|nr:DUF2085 domain-containing protein [Actinomycetota bacterium]
MIAAFLRWLGYGLCHQLPERSFFGGALQLPVCARDTGSYMGFAMAFLLIVALDRERRSSELPPAWLGVWLGVGLLSAAVDGATQLFGLRESTNALRLATGLAMGFAIAAYTVPLLNSQLWRRPGAGRVLGGPGQGVAYLAALPAAFAVLWWAGPRAGVIYAIAVGASIVMTFASVNLVLVALLPPFDQRASCKREILVAVFLAIVVSFAELAVAASVRGFLLGLAGAVS